MKGAPLFIKSCRSAAAELLSAWATCWACAGERVLVPAWLALANYVSLLLYVLLFFERLTEVIFHLAACLLPAFVYVLLALLTSLLSMPPEASSGAIIGDVEAGVAGQQALAQQQLLRPLLRSSPPPADASATAARSSTWEMADLSSLKRNRRHVLTSRQYPLAAAPVASRRAASGFSPAVASLGRVVMLYQNAWGHRNSMSTQKGSHSSSLLIGGVSTRISSMYSNSKGRAKKMQIKKRAATPQGAVYTSSGYARKRYFDYWTETSGTNAEVGRGAASARTVTAEVFSTLTTETRTAAQVRHGFELWQTGLRSIAAASATAAAVTAAGSACAEPASAAEGKEEHTSHAARTDGQHVCDGEIAASTAPDSTQNVLPVTVRVSKAVRDAQRKPRILQREDIRLTYAAINAKAPSPTAGEATGSRDRLMLVGGVAHEALEQGTQNTRAQQSRHAGADKRVDAASAIMASETEAAEGEEDRLESEGRGGEMWLAALLMAYGYVVLSHISRGLLLELPIYSFALYLCQLLRIQGMSFSAGPSSTPPAAEEVAARRWVLFSPSVAGEEASIQESSAPPSTSNESNHSSTASSNCGSGSSSSATTTTSATRSSNGRSRHISHSVRCVENSSCCIRQLRSDDSLRPNRSEKGVRSRTIELIKSNRVAVLCSTDFNPFARARTYSKWKSGDLPARVSASGMTDDNPWYSPVVSMAKEAEAAGVAACTAVAQHTHTEGARQRNVKAGSPLARSFTLEEVLYTGRESGVRRARVRRYCTSVRRWNSISSAGGQEIKDVQAFGQPYSLRTYGCPDGEGLSWKSWDDCWLTSMSYSDLHRFSQTPSGNDAVGGCQPAGRVTTAVEAEAAGVSRGSVGAENFQQRRRNTLFDNVNAAVSRCRATAGIPAAAGPYGRDGEAQHAAIGPGEDQATARGARQSVGVTTAPRTQLARKALREMGKEVATIQVRAGQARKTPGGTLREAAPQERQPHLSGDRPGVSVHAAKLKRESATLAASRAAPKSSAVAQTSCSRKGAFLLVATAENDAFAACASTADREEAAAPVTNGMVELLGGGRLIRNDTERQRGEQALPTAGTRGCSACLLPLMAEETENVVVEGSRGYSTGGEVATQCRTDDSNRRVDGSYSSSICTAAVVQTKRRNTCTAGSRALRESSCVSNAQGWRNFGFVSSVSLEGGAQALLESAAYAAAQTPVVDDVAAARSMRACPSSVVLRSIIALVSRSSETLLRMLRSRIRGLFWRSSYRLTAVVAARLQSIRLWLGSRGKLLRAFHPFQLLSLSPIHFFPNTSQRLIFTTCCFWLLRGLHGDILFEHGTSPSPGAASACGSSVDGWAASDTVLLEPSNAFIRSGDNKGDIDTGSVGMPNIRGGRGSSTHASGSRNLKTRAKLLWREEVVEPDFFSFQTRSELTRDSPSFPVYAPTRRDARSAFAAPREATQIEPSASLLENHPLLVSTAYSRSAGWQHTHQKSSNLTLSPYEEYGSSHFLLVYSFLLNTFQRGRKYLQPLRQWTAWLALLLLLLLMISYSLLSLSSTFEILPWQLLHVLVVLRHTRLCTYAARMVKQRKLHLPAEEHQKGVQRFFGAVDEIHDELPLQGGSQAYRVVKGDVLFTGDHQPRTEDGVDEKKVSSSRRYAKRE